MVVYVHGLWLSGRESIWLRRRLERELQAETRAFSYPSVGGGIDANARALVRFLAEVRADTLHLVGHSLGGLVILKCLGGGDVARLPPGRVVLLGSPLQGSQAALGLARLPLGKKIMGLTVAEELMQPSDRRWDGSRDLGIIAGNRGVGLGRLVGTGCAPSDGTILVEETRLPGAKGHLLLRVSHSGMLFSAEVARQTAAFLRGGEFSR